MAFLKSWAGAPFTCDRVNVYTRVGQQGPRRVAARGRAQLTTTLKGRLKGGECRGGRRHTLVCGMTTMSDVAAHARVSVATVSHVINGTKPVSEATRQRVEASISTIGYRPHSLARALKRSRSESIGLAVSDIGNPYLTEVIKGVDEVARDAGYICLLMNCGFDPAGELAAIDSLAERRVDGLVLALSLDDPEQVLGPIFGMKTPVVLIDHQGNPLWDQVHVAGREAVAVMVEHLVDLGHKRVGMVAGRHTTSTTAERIEGYLIGLSRSGLDLDQDLLVSGSGSVAGGQAAVDAMLSLSSPPTALVIGNNSMTLGAMAALKQHALAVPRDMAVVGYDDFSWTDVFSPGLTTIVQPAHEVGRSAMKLLLRRFETPRAPAMTVELGPELVHRESCGCEGKVSLRSLPTIPTTEVLAP